MNAGKKKLVLNRETVRALQGSEMSQVAGGMPLVQKALVYSAQCPHPSSSTTTMDAVAWAQQQSAQGQGQVHGYLA